MKKAVTTNSKTGAKTKLKLFSTYNIAVIAVFTAMSLVLSEFPKIKDIAGFLDLDFADVPIIFSGFFVGPWAPLIIAAIKNLVGIFSTHTGAIGELSNFILSSAYGLVASLLGEGKGTVRVVLAVIASILVTTALALMTNHFMMLPLFLGASDLTLLFTVILPFNLVKFSAQSAIFLALYFSLRKTMSKLRRREACADSDDPFCMLNEEDKSVVWVDETIKNSFEFQLPSDKEEEEHSAEDKTTQDITKSA